MLQTWVLGHQQTNLNMLHTACVIEINQKINKIKTKGIAPLCQLLNPPAFSIHGTTPNKHPSVFKDLPCTAASHRKQ